MVENNVFRWFVFYPFFKATDYLWKKKNKNAKALRPHLVIYCFRLKRLFNRKLCSKCTKYAHIRNQWIKINMSRYFVLTFSNFRFWRPFWIKNANFSRPFWIVIFMLECWNSNLNLEFSQGLYISNFKKIK